LGIQAVKIRYFEDTDTLYIELQAKEVVESKDLDENTVVDLDASGNLCAITIEQASRRTDLSRLWLEGIAA
jgi:uncharacterized protein YuzE